MDDAGKVSKFERTIVSKTKVFNLNELVIQLADNMIYVSIKGRSFCICCHRRGGVFHSGWVVTFMNSLNGWSTGNIIVNDNPTRITSDRQAWRTMNVNARTPAYEQEYEEEEYPCPEPICEPNLHTLLSTRFHVKCWRNRRFGVVVLRTKLGKSLTWSRE